MLCSSLHHVHYCLRKKLTCHPSQKSYQGCSKFMWIVVSHLNCFLANIHICMPLWIAPFSLLPPISMESLLIVILLLFLRLKPLGRLKLQLSFWRMIQVTRHDILQINLFKDWTLELHQLQILYLSLIFKLVVHVIMHNMLSYCLG